MTSATLGNGLTGLGYCAFANCTGLKTVEFADGGAGSLSLGEDTFTGCSWLEAVKLPDNLTSFGVNAFSSCSSLKALSIPDSVRTISKGAFSYCTLLGEVSLGSGLTAINGDEGSHNDSYVPDNGAFSFCTSLTNVTFGASLKTIGGYAFYKCTSLAGVAIPNSVTSIGRQAFQGCTKMTAATIGSGLTSLGYYSFAECRGLKSLVFTGGDAQLSLGEGVFSGCIWLKSVNITDNVKSIGNSAFKNCATLKSVVLGNGLTSVGQEAFANCTRLRSLNVGTAMGTFGNNAFSGCTDLRYIYFHGLKPPTLGSNVFKNAPGAMIVYVEDGGTGWNGEGEGLPEKWNGWTIKWGSEYSPDADAPYDLVFANSAEIGGSLILCDSPDGKVAQTVFLAGNPIYVRYAFKDAWADENITAVFTNTVNVVRGGSPMDGESIWHGSDEVGSYQIGATVLRTVKMDGIEIGRDHRLDMVLDGFNAVSETDEDNNAAHYSFSVVPSTDVTFISDDNELAKVKYATGEQYGSLLVPGKRTGFEFGGWFADAAFSVAIFETNIVPESAISLYARWDLRPARTNYVSGTVSANARWEAGDLCVVQDNVTIPSDVVLTIDPGVIVKFAAGKSLVVNKGGTLSAIGTRAQPIVFTSIKDDTNGGDTNGDGAATRPKAGDWARINVKGNATMDYCSLLYGSLGNGTDDILTVDGGTVRFSNGKMKDIGKYAVGVENGHFYMNNSVIAEAYCAFRHWPSDPIVNSVIYNCNRLSNNNGQKLYNCIIVGVNEAWDWSSGKGNTYKNCVFWNEPGFGLQKLPGSASSADGNIWADPLFGDPANGNYRIMANSPCVDAGDGTIAPEKDYYGSPRMNVNGVRPTGSVAANGAVPDIGIYEVPGDGNIPAADLTVTSVTVPAKLTVGKAMEVSWKVENAGTETASGMWRDEIEIVAANGQVFSMGTSTVQAEIKPGASANFHAAVVVPAAPEGAVQVRVTANKFQDLFEALNVENNAGATATTLTVPTLAVPTDGTATTVTLNGDSDIGFALDGGGTVATQGGVLIIRGVGELDAWLGNGSVAAKDNAIRTAVKIADDTWLLQIPAGSEPRVTVRNDGDGDVAASLSLEVGGFFLLDTGKVSAANLGVVSVPFVGNGFNDSLVCWLERGGKRVNAADLKVDSGVSANATFDVTGCEAGDWTLHVKKGGDAASATLLTLTQSRIGAKWSCKVNVASTVRSGRTYTGSVEYGNSGDTAMPAPYLHLTANSGTLIRLTEADAWTDSIELMAISATYPASSLKAGESGKVEFFYKTTASKVKVTCDITRASSKAFPWDTNAAYMRPSWATDEMWALALATLKSNVGVTWDDFLQRMRDNADYLMKIGRTKARLDRMWQMVINEALGTDWAIQTLARGTDLARTGRGMGLSFSRTYGSSLSSRLRTGVFGYGWQGNYSHYAELVDSTTLAIHLPSGSTYQFTKVSGKWASEDARDKTKLDETTTDYVLTFIDGTVQTIAKSNMRTSSIRDNQGNELTFTYSGTQLTKVEHTDGQLLTFTYSGGKVASASDDQGRIVRYGYTGDMLTSVTAFNGLVTRYAYHPADGTLLSRALTQITYPDGTTKDYTYDTFGRVATTSVNGNQFTTEIVRTGGGSYAVVAPNGGVTEVTVGAKGNVPKIVNALGQTVKQKYSDTGLLESIIAPSGKRNRMSYNTDGQLVAAASASGAETKFAYEPDFDNLASVTDAKGHAISYGYDNKGRGNSISYVDGSSSSLEYNERGDVVKSTNRRGESITYEYDAEGNLTKKTWPNGRTFTMAYDAKGNVTNAADSVTGAVTMEYDANERLTHIVYPKGRGFTYTYDAVGRMTERTALGGTGSVPSAADTQRFTYDSLGRLSTVTDGDGTPYLTNSYDPTTGWLVTQTYGNGTIVSNAYDILGRTIGIYHGRAVSMKPPYLAFFEYAYDADGKCISQTTAEGTESYTYDADGQLTSVTYPDGTSETFTYDAVGNRIAHTGTTGVSPVAYTVNNLNQYTQIADTTLEYDLDGNMTRNGDTLYYYDTLNRLVAVTNTAKNIRWSCEYDVFGNRVSVTDNGTTTEKVFVQGSLPSVAAEYQGNTLMKRHILVGAVRLADLTTNHSPLTTTYYHSDLLGSARLLTDGTGATKGTRSFKAFGETRISSGEATDAGYVGTLGVESDSNGLLFMRNRYYDAGMGRFMQMDPIGLRAGDVNVYRYCGNDGAYSVDVSGLQSVVCTIQGEVEEPNGCGAKGGSKYPYIKACDPHDIGYGVRGMPRQWSDEFLPWYYRIFVQARNFYDNVVGNTSAYQSGQENSKATIVCGPGATKEDYKRAISEQAEKTPYRHKHMVLIGVQLYYTDNNGDLVF